MSLNIYVLDADSSEAARALSDLHLRNVYGNASGVLMDAYKLRRWVAAELRGEKGYDGPRSCAHPRHPITRHATRSPAYIAWITSYVCASLRELAWRDLAEVSGTAAELAEVDEMLRQLGQHLAALTPVDAGAAAHRRLIHYEDPDEPRDRGLAGFPQRLDDAQDLAIDDDPVTAYRRWYAVTKVPGMPRAWEGASVTWTRREPPAWLTEYGCVIETLPPCGLSPDSATPAARRAVWPVYVARASSAPATT